MHQVPWIQVSYIMYQVATTTNTNNKQKEEQNKIIITIIMQQKKGGKVDYFQPKIIETTINL
jgi:hypothetical protein